VFFLTQIVALVARQVLIQYCGVCLFYADETFLVSNTECPVSSLPSCKPVRWIMSFVNFCATTKAFYYSRVKHLLPSLNELVVTSKFMQAAKLCSG